tara:strand:- start:2832 stop:3194 length:363 start_codon:yes stop_codon:yes gene_type:complete
MKSRVSWDYFMRRRNISYSSLTEMEYDRYVAWCHTRSVIPLEQEEYESNLAPFKKTPKPEPKKKEPVQEVPASTGHTDSKVLSKKKKSDLLDLCRDYGIELEGKETKKQLVSLILDVNKS